MSSPIVSPASPSGSDSGPLGNSSVDSSQAGAVSAGTAQASSPPSGAAQPNVSPEGTTGATPVAPSQPAATELAAPKPVAPEPAVPKPATSEPAAPKSSVSGKLPTKNIVKYAVLGVLAIAVIALVGSLVYYYIGKPYSAPQNVRVTNVSSRSVTVSWVTEDETPGVVIYSEEDNFLPWVLAGLSKSKAYDDRDISFAEKVLLSDIRSQAEADGEADLLASELLSEVNLEAESIAVEQVGNYYTHHVTISGLEPDTTYYFMVGNGLRYEISDDAFASDGFTATDTASVTTFYELDEIFTPDPTYGEVVSTSGDVVSDGMVFMKPGELAPSSPLSAPLSEVGAWYIDLANSRTNMGDKLTALDEDTDIETMYVEAGILGTSEVIENPMSNDAPADDIEVSSSTSQSSLPWDRYVRGDSSEDLARNDLSKELVSYVNAGDCTECKSVCIGDGIGKNTSECRPGMGDGPCPWAGSKGPMDWCKGYEKDEDSEDQEPEAEPVEETPPDEEGATTAEGCNENAPNGTCGPTYASCDPQDPAEGCFWAKCVDGKWVRSNNCCGECPGGTDSGGGGGAVIQQTDAPCCISGVTYTSEETCTNFVNDSGYSKGACPEEETGGSGGEGDSGGTGGGKKVVCKYMDLADCADACARLWLAAGTSATPSVTCQKRDSCYVCPEPEVEPVPVTPVEPAPATSDDETPSELPLLLTKNDEAKQAASYLATPARAADVTYTVSGENILIPDADGVYNLSIPGKGTVEGVRLMQDRQYSFFVDENSNEEYDEGEEIIDLGTFSVDLTVNESKQVFDLSLSSGLNYISFEYLPSNADSCDMIIDINDQTTVIVSLIAQFDSGTFSAVSYRKDEGGAPRGECFPVVPGRGYVIRSYGDADVILDGYKLTEPAQVALPSPGWHLIGVNGTTSVYTAESLIDSLDNIEGMDADNVTRWRTDYGRYYGLQKENNQVYGFDFTVQPGAAYFVRTVEGSGVWQPE